MYFLNYTPQRRVPYHTVATLTSTPHISSSIFRSHNVAVFEWCTGQTPDANKVGRLCRFYVLFPIIYYADVLTYGAERVRSMTCDVCASFFLRLACEKEQFFDYILQVLSSAAANADTKLWYNPNHHCMKLRHQ